MLPYNCNIRVRFVRAFVNDVEWIRGDAECRDRSSKNTASLLYFRLWARHGFDGDVEAVCACRGGIGLLKKSQIVIAKNYEYALAA